MTTNPEAYEARHRRLCESAEEAFALQQTVDAKYSVSRAVKEYAVQVHRAIARRDGIASCHAVKAAHVAMKAPLTFTRSRRN